jgi:hypothetical protein
MSQMMKDIICPELPSIVAEIQQQSAGVYLTTWEYKKDMTAFQTNFHTTLEAQTTMIQQLSSQMQEIQNTTLTHKCPVPSRQEDCAPQRLNTSSPTQDTVESDPFCRPLILQMLCKNNISQGLPTHIIYTDYSH